jgi:hypothetical protein
MSSQAETKNILEPFNDEIESIQDQSTCFWNTEEREVSTYCEALVIKIYENKKNHNHFHCVKQQCRNHRVHKITRFLSNDNEWKEAYLCSPHIKLSKTPGAVIVWDVPKNLSENEKLTRDWIPAKPGKALLFAREIAIARENKRENEFTTKIKQIKTKSEVEKVEEIKNCKEELFSSEKENGELKLEIRKLQALNNKQNEEITKLNEAKEIVESDNKGLEQEVEESATVCKNALKKSGELYRTLENENEELVRILQETHEKVELLERKIAELTELKRKVAPNLKKTSPLPKRRESKQQQISYEKPKKSVEPNVKEIVIPPETLREMLDRKTTLLNGCEINNKKLVRQNHTFKTEKTTHLAEIAQLQKEINELKKPRLITDLETQVSQNAIDLATLRIEKKTLSEELKTKNEFETKLTAENTSLKETNKSLAREIAQQRSKPPLKETTNVPAPSSVEFNQILVENLGLKQINKELKTTLNNLLQPKIQLETKNEKKVEESIANIKISLRNAFASLARQKRTENVLKEQTVSQEEYIEILKEQITRLTNKLNLFNAQKTEEIEKNKILIETLHALEIESESKLVKTKEKSKQWSLLERSLQKTRENLIEEQKVLQKALETEQIKRLESEAKKKEEEENRLIELKTLSEEAKPYDQTFLDAIKQFGSENEQFEF